MASVDFQSATLATPPNTTKVDVTTTGGVSRQIVSIGNTTVGDTGDSIGAVTETAPATDIASSGLNGRLQRIAQRITSMIALLPAALGAGGGLKVDGSGTALPVSGTVATTAHDLLYDTGTNGYIASLTLTAGTDLASLASGGAVTLTGGGSAGVSSQSNTGSGLLAEVVFKTVTAGFTPTAGGVIAIWWLKSDDGGSNYETTPATPSTTVPALPRPPDCIIPLDAAALGTSAIKFSNVCVPPPGTFKCLVQNLSGAAFGAGNYTLTLRVFAKKN